MRVLLVEDDPLVAETLQGLLEAMDYEVAAIATTAAQALDVIDATVPDALMVDVHLDHGGSGIDVASYAYHHRGIRSIFVSGYLTESALARIARLDPIGVLEKPLAGAALRSAFSGVG